MTASVKDQLQRAFGDPSTGDTERTHLILEAVFRQRRHNRRAGRTAAYESLRFCRRFYPWRVPTVTG